MLNKLKIGMIIGIVLTALRQFLPDVDFPAGLEDAIILLIVFVAQFFVRETKATVDGLSLK